MEYTMENLRKELAEINGKIYEHIEKGASAFVLGRDRYRRDFIESVLIASKSEDKEPVKIVMRKRCESMVRIYDDCKEGVDSYIMTVKRFLTELLSTMEEAEMKLDQCVCVTVYGNTLPTVSNRLYVKRVWYNKEKNEIILQGNNQEGVLSFAEIQSLEYGSVDCLLRYIMGIYDNAELKL